MEKERTRNAGSVCFGGARRDTGGLLGRPIILFVLLLLSLAASVVSAAAARATQGHRMRPTYYVSARGSDASDGSVTHPWASLQHAALLAKPGAIIRVQPGIYSGVVTRISGEPNARICFVSEGRWAARLRSTETGYRFVWLNQGDYVDIVGFDISGAGAVGIRNMGSHVRIIGNHVHDIPASGCTSVGGAGINNGNYTGSDNDIIGNIVHDIGVPGTCRRVQGIYHSNLGGLISNNISYNNSAWGISTWHAARKVTIVNNLLFGNGGRTEHGHLGGGIVVGAGDSPGGMVNDGTVVANNILYRNNGFAFSEHGSTGKNNRFYNNLVFENLSEGKLLAGTEEGTLKADPQFVKFAADGSGDYRLRPGSPAIGAGRADVAPIHDFYGAARSRGKTDLGPFAAGTERSGDDMLRFCE